MTPRRAEIAGVGAAVALHVAIFAAMSLSLAHVAKPPEPPAMEVDFVTDEVALEASAPQPEPQTVASPPPAPAEALPTPLPAEPPPLPQPNVVPLPRESLQPTPKPRAQPRPQPRVQRPAPAPARQRQGLGDDFLSKLNDDLAPGGKAAPSAPAFTAAAKANVASSIARQAQRCANRQPYLGEGADEVVMYLTLNFARSGRLVRPPQVTRTAGPADARSRYGELLEDQVRRIFADCAPFRLPAELYDTDDGGWKVTTLRYRVNK